METKIISEIFVPMASIPMIDLFAAGRFPYQGWFRQWTAEDQRVVEPHLSPICGCAWWIRFPAESVVIAVDGKNGVVLLGLYQV